MALRLFYRSTLAGAAVVALAGMVMYEAGPGTAALQATPKPGGPVYLGGGSGSLGGDAAGLPGPAGSTGSAPPVWADDRIEVLVKLRGPSAGEVYAFARQVMPDAVAQAAAQAHRARIEAAQQALLPRLTGPEIQAVIVAQVQWAVNGIILNVEAAHLPLIRRLPGVEAVWPMRTGVLSGPGGGWQPGPSDSVMPVAPAESAAE